MSVGSLSDRAEIPPLIRFETRPVEDKRASLEAGRSVCVDVDYILVTPAYSKDLFSQKVESYFKTEEVNAKNGRTSPQYLEHCKKAYAAFKQGQELPLEGTPIKTWSAISPAQIKNLLSIGILTVEMLARCNDEGKRRIGMGAQDMINKANAWLQSTNDHGAATMKIAQLEAENESLRNDVESLREKLNQLSATPTRYESHQISVSDILDDPVVITPRETPVPQEKSYYQKLEDSTDDQLAKMYTDKYHKPPHHKMKRDTIIQRLSE